MLLLGYRYAAAATQITATQRMAWLKLGCPVEEHGGSRRWRPILSEKALWQAWIGWRPPKSACKPSAKTLAGLGKRGRQTVRAHRPV